MTEGVDRRLINQSKLGVVDLDRLHFSCRVSKLGNTCKFYLYLAVGDHDLNSHNGIGLKAVKSVLTRRELPLDRVGSVDGEREGTSVRIVLLAVHSDNAAVGLCIYLKSDKSCLDLAKIPMLNGAGSAASAICRVVGNHLEVFNEGLRLKLCCGELVGVRRGGIKLISTKRMLYLLLHNVGSRRNKARGLYVEIGKINVSGDEGHTGVNGHKFSLRAISVKIVALGELSLIGVSHNLLKLCVVKTAIKASLTCCGKDLAVLLDLCLNEG